jgi:hypothetical protein
MINQTLQKHAFAKGTSNDIITFIHKVVFQKKANHLAQNHIQDLRQSF